MGSTTAGQQIRAVVVVLRRIAEAILGGEEITGRREVRIVPSGVVR